MEQTSSTRWWAMGATALTLLVVGLDMTILNVALPDIAIDLHASTAQLQWFADAYLLVLAAVMLPAGMLGDRFGRKGLTLGALAVFGAGSAWCAFATTPASLIAGRVVLGVGAAVLIPLAMSAVVVLFDPPERPRAVMVLGMSTMVGLPLGPIAGGLLLQHFWWGSVFVLNLPVIAFALFAVARFMPGSPTRPAAERPGIDVVGALASGLGLLAVTYGVIEAPTRGWSDPGLLATVLGGLLVLVGFVFYERRLTRAVPVFDVALWREPSFRWGAIGATVANLALFGVMFTLPQYFRAVLGSDALDTGLRTLPLVVGMLIAMRGATGLTTRVSGRALAATGFAVAAVGMAIGATSQVGQPFWRCAVWTFIVGLGFGVALLASQNQALLTLPRSRAATGSALVQTLRQAGSVLGIAVLGALLSDRYRSTVDTGGLSAKAASAVRESAQSGVEVAGSTHSSHLAHSVATAFVGGMDATLWVSSGVAVLGAVLALGFMSPHQQIGEAESLRADDNAERADARAS